MAIPKNAGKCMIFCGASTVAGLYDFGNPVMWLMVASLWVVGVYFFYQHLKEQRIVP